MRRFPVFRDSTNEPDLHDMFCRLGLKIKAVKAPGLAVLLREVVSGSYYPQIPRDLRSSFSAAQIPYHNQRIRFSSWMIHGEESDRMRSGLRSSSAERMNRGAKSVN